MGFFDSFSKKKESSPFSLSDLPPPPKMNELATVSMPHPDQMFMPPPPEPREHNLIAPKMPLSLQPPPIPKKEVILAASGFSLPELPKKTEVSIQIVSSSPYVSNAPENLPFMPKSIKMFSEPQDDLKEFSDTYEEIPFFNQESPESMLPVLNLSDTEEEHSFKPVLNTRKPLFIRTDHYSNVLSVIDSVNDYIAVSSDTIYSLENIKKNTEVEHNKYKSVMEDLQRKLIYIDKVLFEKGVQ